MLGAGVVGAGAGAMLEAVGEPEASLTVIPSNRTFGALRDAVQLDQQRGGVIALRHRLAEHHELLVVGGELASARPPPRPPCSATRPARPSPDPPASERSSACWRLGPSSRTQKAAASATTTSITMIIRLAALISAPRVRCRVVEVLGVVVVVEAGAALSVVDGAGAGVVGAVPVSVPRRGLGRRRRRRRSRTGRRSRGSGSRRSWCPASESPPAPRRRSIWSLPSCEDCTPTLVTPSMSFRAETKPATASCPRAHPTSSSAGPWTDPRRAIFASPSICTRGVGLAGEVGEPDVVGEDQRELPHHPLPVEAAVGEAGHGRDPLVADPAELGVGGEPLRPAPWRRRPALQLGDLSLAVGDLVVGDHHHGDPCERGEQGADDDVGGGPPRIAVRSPRRSSEGIRLTGRTVSSPGRVRRRG